MSPDEELELVAIEKEKRRRAGEAKPEPRRETVQDLMRERGGFAPAQSPVARRAEQSAAAALSRYGSALVPGGPAGAAAAGGGEKIAQFIQGEDDPRQVGMAMATGGVPFMRAGGLLTKANLGNAAIAGGTNFVVNKLADALGMEGQDSNVKQAAVVSGLTAVSPMLGRIIGAISKYVAPEEAARLKNLLKNKGTEDKTLAAMQSRGAVIRPSDVRQSLKNDMLEMVAGKTNLDNEASRLNEPIVDDVSRSAANLKSNAQITEATLAEARDKVIAQPWNEARQLGLGREVDAWRDAVTMRQDTEKELAGNFTRAGRSEAINARAAEALALRNLNRNLWVLGRPDLVKAIPEAQVEFARNFDVLDATNLGNQHTDARVLLRKLNQRGEAGLSGGLEDVAKFAAAFPDAVKPTANLATAPSAATAGTMAVSGSQALAAGNVVPAAAVAAIPAWRRGAVNKIMSPEYQAKNAVRDYTPRTSADPATNALLARIAALVAAKQQSDKESQIRQALQNGLTP